MISGFLGLFCVSSSSQMLRRFPGVRAKSWQVRELNSVHTLVHTVAPIRVKIFFSLHAGLQPPLSYDGGGWWLGLRGQGKGKETNGSPLSSWFASASSGRPCVEVSRAEGLKASEAMPLALSQLPPPLSVCSQRRVEFFQVWLHAEERPWSVLILSARPDLTCRSVLYIL